MGFAEKLHHVKTAFVDIEMDVPLFKVWRVGLPYFCFRVQSFNGLPSGKTHTLAVAVHIDEQKLKLIAIGIRMDGENRAAYNFSIQNNIIAFRPLRLKGANHMIPWDNFPIKGTELLHHRFFECDLDITNKRFFLLFLQGNQFDVHKMPP